jgi:hypothetical protein
MSTPTPKPGISEISPYVGGRSSVPGVAKPIKLSSNESPLGPSPKALEASKTAKSVRVFFDWKDYLKFYKMGTYWPYTPSIQLLYGLRAGLESAVSGRQLGAGVDDGVGADG